MKEALKLSLQWPPATACQRPPSCLHISQTAVSRRLKDLEENLGTILIDRHKGLRRAELTLAGEEFFAIAEAGITSSASCINSPPGFRALSLRIGCVDSVSSYLMPPLYRGLRSHQPPVHLKILTTPLGGALRKDRAA